MSDTTDEAPDPYEIGLKLMDLLDADDVRSHSEEEVTLVWETTIPIGHIDEDRLDAALEAPTNE